MIVGTRHPITAPRHQIAATVPGPKHLNRELQGGRHPRLVRASCKSQRILASHGVRFMIFRCVDHSLCVRCVIHENSGA